MPQPPPRRPHPSAHAFTALACCAAPFVPAGIWQGGTQGWALATATLLVTAALALMAWIAWTAPRDDDE